jgi:hypothetical protein
VENSGVRITKLNRISWIFLILPCFDVSLSSNFKGMLDEELKMNRIELIGDQNIYGSMERLIQSTLFSGCVFIDRKINLGS